MSAPNSQVAESKAQTQTKSQSDLPSSKTYNRKLAKSGFFKAVAVYYRRYWRMFIWVFVFAGLSAAGTILVPKITNQALAAVSVWADVIKYSLILVGLQIAAAIFRFFQNYIGGLFGTKVEIDLRQKTLSKLLEIDMSYYQDQKTGTALTKLIGDTQIVGTNTQQIPTNIFYSICVFIGSFVIMITINYILALIIVAIAIIVLAIATVLFMVLRRYVYNIRKIYTSVNDEITDRLGVISLIKSNGTEKYEENHISDLHHHYYQSNKKMISYRSFLIAVLSFSLFMLNVVAIIGGLILIKAGKLGPGDLVAFVLSINTLIMPIMTMVTTLSNFANASTSMTRINEILAMDSLIKLPAKPKVIKGLSGDIVFDHVSFHYPTKNENEPFIFHDFNFRFKQGKSYAIVGETGAGKSTISKLLLRFYDPTSGKILINNKIDLKTVDLESYLSHIGYVEQDPQIIYGNFYQNISYGSFNASKTDIISAAKKADLHKFIMGLPKQYDTILGEKGFILSGGQKQRLVIARMFLKNPSLLILDEATSSLDNIVEKEIQAELDKLMVNRTSIVIAHRLSTIRNVDEILVLSKEEAGVVQTGTFEALKNKPGRFKQLYEAGLMQ